MKNQRLALATALVGIVSSVAGCSSTFRLYVANDTPRPYALRINDSADAYPLQPSTKHTLPDRLQRGKAYSLFALDRSGHRHQHRIMTDAPQLFVHLRENSSGVLEWLVSESPPVE